MDCVETNLPGCKVLTPRRFGDARGWFSEVYNQQSLAAFGMNMTFVQDNHSFSAATGTLRGLHYQAPPHAQDKLVRVGRGAIWDVAVDIRRGSPTYGQSFGVELSAENGKQLMVPIGFLHGFVTLEADTEVLYKCSDVYAPDCDGSVLWNSCGVDWPLEGEPTLSDKDVQAVPFDQFESPFEWGEQS